MAEDWTDWRDVCETRYVFAAAVDGRDWAALAGVLADPIRLDYSSYSGKPADTLARADWVQRCRNLFEGLDATQHSLSNPRIRITGDTAWSTMYLVAEHLLDGERYTIGGQYTDVLVRTDRWRLSDMTLTVHWRHGDAAVLDRARRSGRPESL